MGSIPTLGSIARPALDFMPLSAKTRPLSIEACILRPLRLTTAPGTIARGLCVVKLGVRTLYKSQGSSSRLISASPSHSS